MSGIGATLAKKVGPLPLGAWLAAVGVGGFITYRGRSSSSLSAPATSSTSSGPAGSGDPLPTGGGYGSADNPTGSQDNGTVVLSPVFQVPGATYFTLPAAAAANQDAGSGAMPSVPAASPIPFAPPAYTPPPDYSSAEPDSVAGPVTLTAAPPAEAPRVPSPVASAPRVVTGGTARPKTVAPTTRPAAPKPAPRPATVKVAARPAAIKTATKPARPSSYKVSSGDTLSGIAARFYGDAGKWQSIYAANRVGIEAGAKAHGRKNSDGGHWIYPGVTLRLP